ncbi:hypothetical protein ACFVG9_36445 [Saccharothrix carnea]|uniref:hypothetical protein n=1 Tax=Saccharothrix carnea TaxID=1280637 RepID=UPI00363A208B
MTEVVGRFADLEAAFNAWIGAINYAARRRPPPRQLLDRSLGPAPARAAASR